MRFKYKKKNYPAIKIGDVYYVRDEKLLKSECYKENKRLKKENEKLRKENQRLKTEIEKNKLNYISSTIKLNRA